MELLTVKHKDFTMSIECCKFDAIWNKAARNVGEENLTSTYSWSDGVESVVRLDEEGNEADIGTYLVQIIVGKYYIYDESVEGGKYCIHGNPFTPDITISGTNPITPDYSEDLYIQAAIAHYNSN